MQRNQSTKISKITMRKILFDCEIKTITSLIEIASQEYSDQIFVSVLGEQGTIDTTYKALYNEAVDIAHEIIQKFGLHGNIAIVGRLSKWWIVRYFAILLSGNTVVPIAGDNSLALIDALHFSNCVACFLEDSLANKIDLQRECACAIINTKPSKMQAGIGVFPLPNISPHDIAMIVFTSGTAGKPKAVCLSHFSIMRDVQYSAEIMGKSTFEVGDSIVPVLPPFHMFEITTGLLTPICYGAKIGISNTEINLRKAISVFAPSALVMVPLIAANIQKQILSSSQTFRCLCRVNSLLPKNFFLKKRLGRIIQKNLGGKLKVIVCGGAAIDKTISDWFNSVGISFLTGYGITECSPVVSCNSKNAFRAGSVGKPLTDYCTVEIIDDEIVITGDILFSGYYNESHPYNKSKDCFFTGDIGYFDDDGFLYVTGRKKDVLVGDNGVNIMPAELENLLLKHDIIEEALVCFEHKHRQTCLAAYVYLSKEYTKALSDADITCCLETIRDTINQKTSRDFYISIIRQIPKGFEKNLLGKVKRYVYVDQNGFWKNTC